MNSASRGRRFMSAFALAAALVSLYSMRRADPDLWGYLAYGNLFVATHGLTTHDPFAYTSSGFHWVTFEYGAHLLLWWAYDLAGPPGLIALKCLAGGAALWGLYAAIRLTADDPFTWAPVLLLCTSAICRFFLFRPQLFTFAFFACFVAVLFRFLLRRRAPLWALPLVTLAWANMHGGFVAGLGAVGLTILLRASGNLGAAWRPGSLLAGTGRLWAAFAACLAVSFVNPLGARLWGYILTELSHGTNRQYIAEWGPATLSGDAWSTIALTFIAVTLAVVAWAAYRHAPEAPGPPPLAWALSCVPLIAMSYLSVRHVPLAAIWTGPVIALLASRVQDQLPRLAAFRRAWFLLRGIAVVQVCLIFFVVYAQPRPEIRIDGTVLGTTHPCGAVAYLREQHLRGNLFNPLWWGSYITWERYPDVRVSMDGRNVSLFPDAMVLENMKFYTDAAGIADLDTPLRYPTDFLIVPADAPVLPRVQSDARWRRIYGDADAVLFERTSGRVTPPEPASQTAPLTRQTARCEAVLK